MKKFRYFSGCALLFLLTIVSSCSKTTAPIEEEKFIALSAEALVFRELDHPDQKIDSLLAAFHISHAEYDSSVALYSRNSERWKNILEKISTRIEQL